MNIGQLNRRIKILKFVEVRDQFGGVEGTWEVVAIRWARIEQGTGNETNDNNQVQARLNTKFVIRYSSELTEKNRILYKDKLYEIDSVADVETGHYMTLINATELKDGV